MPLLNFLRCYFLIRASTKEGLTLCPLAPLVQLSFSFAGSWADTHLDEQGEQPVLELLHAMAGALTGEHSVGLPVQLQPHSLFWGLLLFFQLRSELC